MIESIVRSSLEDEILITGLKARLAEMDPALNALSICIGENGKWPRGPWALLAWTSSKRPISR